MLNESSLTGESNPVIKYPFKLKKDAFDFLKNKNNIIFSGTEIL
jgi:magnesium-transporting ATPase (P-type)